MYMEFSIYRLDYISSVYIHTHVGLVSAVPGALVTTRPCEDRAYEVLVRFVGATLRGGEAVADYTNDALPI